jgi:nitrate/nitrite transporter NarK
LFVGLAGGSFSVGTPYVARWFPRPPDKGMAMGVYGAGNSGDRRSTSSWPRRFWLSRSAGRWCRTSMPAAMLATAILFWMFS